MLSIGRGLRCAVLIAVLGTNTGVIAACGGDEPAIKSAAPTTTVQLGQSRPVPGGVVSLAVRFEEPLRAGSKTVWFLTVSNNGESASLNFPSGQRGEVVLLRADGSEAYRWSAKRSFVQAIAKEQLPTGNTLVYELGDTELSVEPGEYELVASVVATPVIPAVRQKVVIN